MNAERLQNIADAIQLAGRERARNSRANNTPQKFVASVRQYCATTATRATDDEIEAVLNMTMAEAFGMPKE